MSKNKSLGNDKYERVQSMILDNGQTWDLSPKDKDALRHVLSLVNSLAGDLAEAVGLTVPEVLSHHNKAIELNDGD